MPRSATTAEPREFTGGIVEADTDPELRTVLVRETKRLQAALTHLLGDDRREPAASLLASLWGRGLYAFVVRK